ncbi:MFS transporter [Thalassospira lucentensis]|uniref:MFS transporter n=1 Tax=Thalassospira lucentensis TaxID=168935 RepID=A0A154L2I0_9PROT|nr:MFS transporter [Thalassospira lucentensis]KZB62285.1 MFS transporter [Thalassospira lucentensis]
MNTQKSENTPGTAAGPWSPFRHRAFAFLWIATVVSNIGTWMHDVGAGWLMTELSPSPFVVALVQAATTLPVFLFAIFAGALADLMDRRKLLLAVNLVMAGLAAALSSLVYLQLVTPSILIAFTFMMGTCAALMAPAWQAIVPSLVDKSRLAPAIALNSMGINVSRAIGPALAGFLIVSAGLVAPFALNAISFVGILVVLFFWKPAKPEQIMPREKVFGAMRAGLRYVFNSPPVIATLVRAVAFFVFASAYWAMLPLIAREVLSGGPQLYGILLASVGAGAVIGAVVLPRIKARLGADKTVMAGTVGTASVLVAFALIQQPVVAVIASFIAGASWIAVLSSFNVSAQTALPDWVRARGLSVFLTLFFGAMSGGSILWGWVADQFSIETALLCAAAGAIVLMFATMRFALNQGANLDLAPSMHWPEPIIGEDVEHDRGPVMIRISYRIADTDRETFGDLMKAMRKARQRHGAYHWNLYQDSKQADLFTEVWSEGSWIEHLRHHKRVTGTDRVLQEQVNKLHQGEDKPLVEHLIAAR